MRPNRADVEKISDGIDMVKFYSIVQQVVAEWNESEYTDDNERQIEVLEHNDLSNQASDSTTSQG